MKSWEQGRRAGRDSIRNGRVLLERRPGGRPKLVAVCRLLWPQKQDAFILHVDHDLSSRLIRLKGLSLCKVYHLSTRMYLATVPPQTFHQDTSKSLAWRWHVIHCTYVYSRYETVGRQLVIGRVAGAAHEHRFAIGRDVEAGDCSQRSAFREG